MTKRLMKYQGGGLAKRSRFGGVARYAASAALSAVPYGRAALGAYRGAKVLYRAFRGSRSGGGGGSGNSNKRTDNQPAQPVETGQAYGHSAYTTTKRQKKVSKKSFKKKKRWELKVRTAVNGSSKFQQYFQNCILGDTTAADVMSWWEIPIMAGAMYDFPGTSTDANNIYFRVNNDEGDFIPAGDIAANSNWSRQTLTGQTVAGTALAATDYRMTGSFLVYGYVLEYNIQNLNTGIPITVEIFEIDCIKDYNPKTTNPLFGGAGTLAVGTSSMLNAAATANTSRQALVQASGTQIAVSRTAIGVTPFLFGDMGTYIRVVKSHVHVLDSGQIMRLQKKYFFKGGIRFPDMDNCMMKKGRTHFLVGTVRATNIGTGNYAGNMGGAAAGAGGFTHSYAVNYNKRFIVKPLDIGNTSFGMRNQVL